MNNGIVIGSYVVYPAFFVLAFVLIFIIMFLLFIFIKINAKSKIKKYKSISSWQKKTLPIIINKYMENNEDMDKELVLALQSVCTYIKKNSLWGKHKLLAGHPRALEAYNLALSDALLNYFVESSEINCLRIIQSLDQANGADGFGIKTPDWMNSEVVEEFQEIGADSNMKRAKQVWKDALIYVYSMFDYGEFMPSREYEPEWIADTRKSMVEKAAENLMSSSGFAVSKETADIIAKGILYMYFYERILTVPSLSAFSIDQLRALACVIKKDSYPNILSVI